MIIQPASVSGVGQVDPNTTEEGYGEIGFDGVALGGNEIAFVETVSYGKQDFLREGPVKARFCMGEQIVISTDKFSVLISFYELPFNGKPGYGAIVVETF